MIRSDAKWTKSIAVGRRFFVEMTITQRDEAQRDERGRKQMNFGSRQPFTGAFLGSKTAF
ncbi:MAG: hypothetical protein LWX55_12325 [Deltaproteobacteria bacterium]|jgi:hypothetical protein|nr:hypothetical protein [Deltaproteobacteria bacterium]